MSLNINLTRRNIEKKFELCCGHLLNPYLKVFFIAISRIKQARRLIFSMSLNIKLTRRNIEEKNGIMLSSSSIF